MIYRIWSLIKLIYLYLLYWIVGLTEEEFHLPKANYCADIGWYHEAIKAYNKALNESNNPLIHAALGWCYAEVRMNEKAVEHYRIAYLKKSTPEIAIGLAYVEYSIGNIAEFQNVYQYLNNSKMELTSEQQNELSKLNKMWGNVVKTTNNAALNQMKA